VIILPKINAANNDPIGLQLIIIPTVISDIPFSLANDGKNGAIIDLDTHSKKPQKLSNPKTSFLFIFSNENEPKIFDYKLISNPT